MSGHTYIFEEIEILVYGSGRQNLNLVPKIRFPLMVLIGGFFYVNSNLYEATGPISA